MRDGMYGMVVKAEAGQSAGSLVMQGGRIFGIDEGGALYDGTYEVHDGGKTDFKIRVSMAANAPTVLGVSAPEPWAVDLVGSADFDQEQGQFQMDTPIGKPIAAAYRFLRPIAPPA